MAAQYLTLSLSSIFPEEKRNEFESYVAGISRKKLLQFATHFLGFDNKPLKEGEIHFFLINQKEGEMRWFSGENHQVGVDIWKKASKAARNHGGQIIIINSESSLRWLEYALEGEDENYADNDPGAELRLFKVISL